jgi:hypothetical protein
MTGDASQWYTLLERNQDTPSWDEFVKLVNRRFGPPLRGNALGELIQLRRDSSIVDYQTKFLSLLARCEDLMEKRQINIFTAGLRNPPNTDVELKNLATLEDAMALARTYEQRLSLQEDDPYSLGVLPQAPAVAGATICHGRQGVRCITNRTTSQAIDRCGDDHQARARRVLQLLGEILP